MHDDSTSGRTLHQLLRGRVNTPPRSGAHAERPPRPARDAAGSAAARGAARQRLRAIRTRRTTERRVSTSGNIISTVALWPHVRRREEGYRNMSCVRMIKSLRSHVAAAPEDTRGIGVPAKGGAVILWRIQVALIVDPQAHAPAPPRARQRQSPQAAALQPQPQRPCRSADRAGGSIGCRLCSLLQPRSQGSRIQHTRGPQATRAGSRASPPSR